MEFRMNAKGVREEFVKRLLVGSALERAGLKVGDQIVKMTNDSGENIVETDNEYGTAGVLLLLVPRTKPLPIEILRDGRKITLELESDMINKN